MNIMFQLSYVSCVASKKLFRWFLDGINLPKLYLNRFYYQENLKLINSFIYLKLEAKLVDDP